MKDIQDVVPKQLEYASTVRQQGAIGTLCGETKRGTRTEGGLVCPSGFVNLLSANMDTGQEGA
jgi:hypothetical protein